MQASPWINAAGSSILYQMVDAEARDEMIPVLQQALVVAGFHNISVTGAGFTQDGFYYVRADFEARPYPKIIEMIRASGLPQ